MTDTQQTRYAHHPNEIIIEDNLDRATNSPLNEDSLSMSNSFVQNSTPVAQRTHKFKSTEELKNETGRTANRIMMKSSRDYQISMSEQSL